MRTVSDSTMPFSTYVPPAKYVPPANRFDALPLELRVMISGLLDAEDLASLVSERPELVGLFNERFIDRASRATILKHEHGPLGQWTLQNDAVRSLLTHRFEAESTTLPNTQLLRNLMEARERLSGPAETIQAVSTRLPNVYLRESAVVLPRTGPASILVLPPDGTDLHGRFLQHIDGGQPTLPDSLSARQVDPTHLFGHEVIDATLSRGESTLIVRDLFDHSCGIYCPSDNTFTQLPPEFSADSQTTSLRTNSSSDGRYVAALIGPSRLLVYDTLTKAIVTDTPMAFTELVTRISVDCNGTVMIASLWEFAEVARGTRDTPITAHPESRVETADCSFVPGDRCIISTSPAGIRLLDRISGETTVLLHPEWRANPAANAHEESTADRGMQPLSIAFSPGNAMVSVFYQTGLLVVFNLMDTKPNSSVHHAVEFQLPAPSFIFQAATWFDQDGGAVSACYPLEFLGTGVGVTKIRLVEAEA